jgi:AcrR family transcriptional regulator
MSNATQPRWRRRKDARPQEIITAALSSFAERGFAATRLDDIAARAGVTRGTLYLYFSSKEELFKAVVRQFLLPIFARREEMLAAATGPTPDLLAKFILSFPEAIGSSPVSAIPKLVLSEAGNFPDLARFYVDEVLRRGRRLVRGLLRRGIERGEFRNVDVDQVFYCVVAPLLVTMLWRHSLAPYDKDGPDLPALCRAHVDLLLHGLLKPEAAA